MPDTYNHYTAAEAKSKYRELLTSLRKLPVDWQKLNELANGSAWSLTDFCWATPNPNHSPATLV